MNYLQSEVSTHPGDIVEVTLHGNAANVLILDSSNFLKYQHGKSFTYFGGHYKMSLVRIRPPAGNWHVVVDLGGRTGTVKAAVRVIRNR